MAKIKAKLILENGRVFEGYHFGAVRPATGEVGKFVFFKFCNHARSQFWEDPEIGRSRIKSLGGLQCDEGANN